MNRVLIVLIAVAAFAALCARSPVNVGTPGPQWILAYKPGYTGAEYDKGRFTAGQLCNEAGRYQAAVQAAQLNAPVATWQCKPVVVPEVPR